MAKITNQEEQDQKEEALQLAIQDVEHGYSQRSACERRGVKKTTLWGRLNGRKERHAAHAHEQRVFSEEEMEVVNWCRQMERRYLPVRLVHLVGCAEAILNNRLATSGEHMGEHWGTRFMLRHPELTLTTSKRIDEKRVMAKNPAYILEFYILLSNVLRELDIKPSNIYNMDEKGFQLGITGQEKVVILRRNRRNGYAGGSKHYGNRETITTIDCICADGTVLPPMIIMKGKYVQKSWMANSPLPEETRWACSPSGWTDNELGVEWIQAFDEWTRDKVSNGEWRCLIVDGHGSHLIYEFLQCAFKAQIIVTGLPSHTTEFLQPLDRVVFRALQRYYGQAVQKQMRKRLTVTKGNFGQLLNEARGKAYTRETILSAFEATGIHPFDAYRSDVMREFQDKIRFEHLDSESNNNPAAPPRTPRRRRIAVAEHYRELVHNGLMDPELLRNALADALAIIDGAEARAIIIEADLQQLQYAVQERQKKKPRGGRVGHARVYRQDRIEEVRQQEESRALVVAARERGKGRGRGRGRGRGQIGRGKGRKSQVSSSDGSTSSLLLDSVPESEDST